jgi:hypothetical protein
MAVLLWLRWSHDECVLLHDDAMTCGDAQGLPVSMAVSPQTLQAWQRLGAGHCGWPAAVAAAAAAAVVAAAGVLQRLNR